MVLVICKFFVPLEAKYTSLKCLIKIKRRGIILRLTIIATNSTTYHNFQGKLSTTLLYWFLSMITYLTDVFFSLSKSTKFKNKK